MEGVEKTKNSQSTYDLKGIEQRRRKLILLYFLQIFLIKKEIMNSYLFISTVYLKSNSQSTG